jgi:hypothetical protein
MSFYEFDQNNTGGSFEITEKLKHTVIIESDTAKEANKAAKKLGIYFDGCYKGKDCACCGDRWDIATDKIELPCDWSNNGKQVTKTVEEYAQKNSNLMMKYITIIHYKDGSTKIFEPKKRES